MSKQNVKLVWSDDPKDKSQVDGKGISKAKSKGGNQSLDVGLDAIQSTNWVAVFRIEKGGRGGKTVTVIDQLPKLEVFLEALCKELKSKCGSGGTYSMAGKEGLIEIQGDKRVAIKAIFDKKGYKYKGMWFFNRAKRCRKV